MITKLKTSYRTLCDKFSSILHLDNEWIQDVISDDYKCSNELIRDVIFAAIINVVELDKKLDTPKHIHNIELQRLYNYVNGDRLVRLNYINVLKSDLEQLSEDKQYATLSEIGEYTQKLKYRDMQVIESYIKNMNEWTF